MGKKLFPRKDAKLLPRTVHTSIPKVMVVLGVLVLLIPSVGLAAVGERYYLTPPTGIPAELWSYFIPRDNPLTSAKVELGRQLFFDKRLSHNGSVSCASCHDPKLAFTDGRCTAVCIDGRVGTRDIRQRPQ